MCSLAFSSIRNLNFVNKIKYLTLLLTLTNYFIVSEEKFLGWKFEAKFEMFCLLLK